jgi:hypothetical protein
MAIAALRASQQMAPKRMLMMGMDWFLNAPCGCRSQCQGVNIIMIMIMITLLVHLIDLMWMEQELVLIFEYFSPSTSASLQSPQGLIQKAKPCEHVGHTKQANGMNLS